VGTVCIIGNQNSGKSTLFNLLTKSQSQVGNWPGVTVEILYKKVFIDNDEVKFVDLPGSYGIRNNTTLDEKETTDFLLKEDYDLILNLIDITSLERSLLLTVQLLELGKPVVVILNKIDLIDKKQLLLLKAKLMSVLKLKILTISAQNKSNIDEINASIKELRVIPTDKKYGLLSLYPKEIISVFKKEKQEISLYQFIDNIKYSQEKNFSSLRSKLSLADNAHFSNEGEITVAKEMCDDDLELTFIEIRYEIVKKILKRINISVSRTSNKSDYIDSILLNRFIGIPFFFFLMYLMFCFSIELGGILQPYFEIIAWKTFAEIPLSLFEYAGIDNKLITIPIYGLGNGLRTVAAFIPLIAFLYLFISILEESGYLTRAAFVMNRLLKKIGLEGKSLIPLIVGFGCNVPAIMSTRIIKNKTNRLAVILAIPFISCSARLSVFLILSSVFFKDHANNLIFILYLIGIFFGLLSIIIVNKCTSNQNLLYNDFLVELPDYQLPKIKAVLYKAWYKTKDFVVGAGKLIIIVCVIIQIMNSFSFHGFINKKNQDSILISVGKSITPIFEPIGITKENWPASVGIIAGLLAKEVIIGTLNSLYSINQHNNQINYTENDNDYLREFTINKMKILFHSKLSVFCYMLFILLYFPCISVFSAIHKELGLSWAVVSSLWSTLIAYACAVSTYQFGTYLSKGTISLLPIILSISLVFIITIVLIINIKRDTENAAQ